MNNDLFGFGLLSKSSLFSEIREDGLIEILECELKRLADLKVALENDISSLPKGKMLYNMNGSYCKWYISNGTEPVYLPKSNRKLAIKLTYRNYCIKRLECITQEMKYLQQCLENCQKIKDGLEAILNDNSEQGRLLKEYFLDYNEESWQWLDEKCEYSTNYPEHLIHSTLKGHMVRSKSEVIIANALYLNKVPYRYECGLYLDGVQYFPDFTLFHAAKNKKIYWEHFGMMDIPHYCEKTYRKLKIYGDHAILPSINLITTFETLDHPIDSGKIQHLIDEYFH